MLLACRRLGLSTEEYVDPEHPLQRRNLERFARFCRVDPGMVKVAVDGCSVPTYRVPLESIALGYAALAHPDAAGHLEAEDRILAGRVIHAMSAAPEMVAGPGRFTTRLIEETGGRIVGKEGAEGVYAAAVRGPAAFGLALKIADGGDRCRDGVVLEMLRVLGALSAEELERLEEFYRPERRNHRGTVVGRVEPDVEPEAPRDEDSRDGAAGARGRIAW
jgi:L-asparaginase II